MNGHYPGEEGQRAACEKVLGQEGSPWGSGTERAACLENPSQLRSIPHSPLFIWLSHCVTIFLAL